MQIAVAWTAMLLAVSASAAANGIDPPVTLESKRAFRPVRIDRPAGALAGGEDFAIAAVIPSLPFNGNGNTCGAVDNYTPVCAFADDSTAPEHVYSFTPTSTVCVDISLCGSGYDTILYVCENDASNVIACNDDRCGFQSRIEGLTLTPANAYYIIVDGWSSQCGEYVLRIEPVDLTLAGTIYYYAPAPLPNSKPVPDVLFCTTPPVPEACGISTLAGTFKIPHGAPGIASLDASRPPSSTDASSIGGGDVNMLVQALAAAVTLDPGQQLAGDVDRGGGQPNASDLQALRRYLVFDIPSCPDCGTWRILRDPTIPMSDLPVDVEFAGCENMSIGLRGIFIGDIDGSWPTRFTFRGDTRPIPLTFGAPEWNAEDVAVALHATIDEAPLESLLFSLEYDATALELLGASPGHAAATFDLTVNDARAGTLHGILSGSRATASGPILELHFRSRSDQPGQLSFSRLLANDVPAPALDALELDPETTAPVSTRYQLRTSPNPFNPTLWVDYAIPAGSGRVPVVLQVHDLSGRLVRHLFDGERDPGPYRAVWDGRGDDGRALASGVYLLHMRAGTWQSSRKSVLLR